MRFKIKTVELNNGHKEYYAYVKNKWFSSWKPLFISASGACFIDDDDHGVKLYSEKSEEKVIAGIEWVKEKIYELNLERHLQEIKSITEKTYGGNK